MVTTRSSKPALVEKEKVPEKKAEEMEVEKSEAQKAEEKENLIIQDLKLQLKEIERAVLTKEPRVISKVSLRSLSFGEKIRIFIFYK